jgi:hypothetical protein
MHEQEGINPSQQYDNACARQIHFAGAHEDMKPDVLFQHV